MLQRAISGLIFVCVLSLCIYFGPIPLVIFFGIASVVGMHEFYAMTNKSKDNGPFVYSGIVVGLLLYALIVGIGYEWLKLEALVWMLPLIVCFFLFALFSKRKFPSNRLASTFFCWLYIALPFGLIGPVSNTWGEYNFEIILGFFIMLWLNDTGAYLAGRSMGKTPLFPRHSPKKTWEGFVGGVTLCLITGYVLSHFFEVLPLLDWMVMAAIIAIFGNLGDLTESMIKRQYGVKDSGKIMPGHGGVLDRFDGVLLSMPLIYTYFTLQYGF